MPYCKPELQFVGAAAVVVLGSMANATDNQGNPGFEETQAGMVAGLDD